MNVMLRAMVMRLSAEYFARRCQILEGVGKTSKRYRAPLAVRLFASEHLFMGTGTYDQASLGLKDASIDYVQLEAFP